MKLSDLTESVSDLEEYARTQLCVEIMADWVELSVFIYQLHIITDIPVSISPSQYNQLCHTSGLPEWCYSGDDDQFLYQADNAIKKDWYLRGKQSQLASNNTLVTTWADFCKIVKDYCQDHDSFDNDFQE